MFAIGMGMRHVQGTLPDPVYALLSGLNSAITGVIAFAGLQLAQRAVTCPMDIFLIATCAAVACLYEGLCEEVRR
jgi:chromate transport protein ChrA